MDLKKNQNSIIIELATRHNFKTIKLKGDKETA